MARIPKYRRHSSRDFAFVEVGGSRIRLPGRWGSQESRGAYARLLAELAEQRPQELPPRGLSVVEVVKAYLDHALVYYAGGKEYGQLRYAAGPLVDVCGDEPAESLGPQSLRQVRAAMVARGWTRRHVNHQVLRVRRMFRWALEQELISPAVVQRLASLSPLRQGRTSASEAPPVLPAAFERVETVAAVCSPTVAAMLRLQALTGMRSGNLCQLRPADLDRAGAVWWYRPQRHKTAWRGRCLAIALGPRAQAVLRPFLRREPDAYCFSPRESEAWRHAQQRAARQTPVQPSQVARSVLRRRRPRRDHYTPDTYRQAIEYGVLRAWPPPEEISSSELRRWIHDHGFAPHQIRHAVGTRIRAECGGLEAAQLYLGHARADVTQIYAERDLARLEHIALQVG